MAIRKIKRKAWNRGTAVYLGGNRVRFIWPCNCKQTEAMEDPAKRPLSPTTVEMLVRNWRLNGVVLDECKKHPGYYHPKCQVARLNEENPQELNHVDHTV